jgi:ubiquinone/menaquinone biosynthesis C-methylase UbiE
MEIKQHLPKKRGLKWVQKHIITKELLGSGILKGNVIELGCGRGQRAFLAALRYKIKLTGVDMIEEGILYASKTFKLMNLKFMLGDVLNLTFEDLVFDNAYMLAVIEHIEDTNKLLNEIRRVVKFKGKLFLSVTENDYHSDPGHVHVFNEESLKEVLEKYFKILNIYVSNNIIFATVEIK